MNNQKGFINLVSIIVIVVLVGLAGYFLFTKESEPVPQQLVSNFEARKEDGKVVLYSVNSDGTSQKTGLEVALVKAGAFEVPVKIVVSPDRTKTVFNKWNNATLKNEIYVSNVDGSSTRLLTQQEVGEGQGSLNQDSLTWTSDSKYITYFETQLTCEGNCPTPEDLADMKVKYQVNIATGEKKVKSNVPF